MIIQEKLASSPFLAGASLPLEQVTSKRFRAGQIISDKPSGVSSVGMIVSGRVEVYSVALDGKDVQLNALTAGECFGVCNLMASAELETVLRCGEETEVLYIPKAVLLSCMEQDAGLAMRYAALCNWKVQFLLRRIELLTMQSCRGRLIAHLLEQQDEKGVVRLAGSREDLIVYPACTGRRSGQEADYALCPSAAWLEHLSHVDFYRLYCTKLPSAIEFAYA